MYPLYTFVWRRDGSPGISWHIRWLDLNGFAGEIHYRPPPPTKEGRVAWAQHNWSVADKDRVAAILAEFCDVAPIEPGPCFALLARRTEPEGQPAVVFKYELDAEASSPQATSFLELHAIIEKYLGDAYAQVAA
jgi:hypothetical protein